MPDKVRIDKWLWSVRIYKSRSLAAKACKSSKVKLEDTPVKASQMVSVGDELIVKKNGYNYQFKILKLIEKRVGAPLAQECYEDLTPKDELNKFNEWYIGTTPMEKREKGAGRPTKKERRELDEYKKRIFR